MANRKKSEYELEINSVHNDLKILERIPKQELPKFFHNKKCSYAAYYRCLCICGNDQYVTAGALIVSGRVKSCGCKQQSRSEVKLRDYSGMDHEYFDILEKLDMRPRQNSRTNNPRWVRYYRFRCKACGNIFEKPTDIIYEKNIKSCGCVQQSKRLQYFDNGALNKLYLAYIKEASDREIIFNLDTELFEHLVFQNCCYCGDPPSKIIKTCSKLNPQEIIYNGIDRIDSSLPYQNNNCITCCTLCNWTKSNQSLDDFINRAKIICCREQEIRSTIIQIQSIQDKNENHPN